MRVVASEAKSDNYLLMADGLKADEQELLEQLPTDGSTRGNKTLRDELSWDDVRYWRAQNALRDMGYAKAGRGKGGSLRRLLGDRHVLLAEVPVDGGAIGNRALQSKLNWAADKYWEVRDQLLDDGAIEKGRGKGGSVRRVVEHDIDDPPVAASLDENGGAYKSEKDLYPVIEKVLEEDWARDERLSRTVIEVTAYQGRRRTGGKWTQPDLAVLSERRYPLTNRVVFDVTTFEVKLGGCWDVTAIYEAAAHSTQATYSYAFLHHEAGLKAEDVKILARCEKEARRLGIGLISSQEPSDYGQWELRVEAARQNPDPEALELFVATQITEEGRAVVKGWWSV